VLQAATQVSPGTGSSAEAAKEAQGTKDNAGGDGGAETDDGASEYDGSDKADSDGTEDKEQKSGSGRKRYRKLLHTGSNAVAHALMKRCMGLCMRDAIGPLMEEGPANAQRNAIAIAAVEQFNIKDLHDFTQCKDPKFEKRMKDCANQAD
jgi:hypothetical protein